MLVGKTEAGANVTIDGIAVENNFGNFSSQIKLSEGRNNITVGSKDRAGNTITRAISVLLDTTPPSIILLSPQNNTVSTQKVRITIKSEDGVYLTVNARKATPEVGGIFYFDVDLMRGGNNFTIIATDAAENAASKEMTIEYIPPKLSEPPSGNDGTLIFLLGLITTITLLILFGIYLMRHKKGSV
jgi:hypothetical protein